MRLLAKAISKKRRSDKHYTGTSYATSALMTGVSHQQLENLLDGTSPPWTVRVATMQEIVRVFPELKPGDFYKPL